MPESFESPELQQAPPSRPPLALLVALVAVIAVLIGAWIAFTPGSQKSPRSSAAVPPMTPAEQAYVSNVTVEDIALSRAENFLHQQVTILNANVTNHGSETLVALYLQVQFDDSMGQIALRESRPVLPPPASLAPGQSRSIEISFDHVPLSWNFQQPSVRVIDLQFASRR